MNTFYAKNKTTQEMTTVKATNSSDAFKVAMVLFHCSIQEIQLFKA